MTTLLHQLLGSEQKSAEEPLQDLVANFLKDKKVEKETNFGLRPDKTQKGEGFFGQLEMKDGGIMTELSIGVNLDGEEILIPSIVPSLSKEELDNLLSGGEITDEIFNKAIEFARKRKDEKKPFFATEEEEGLTEFPESRKE